MKKAVIFDMDGVLIDSEPIYMYETMEFFRQHDVNVTRSEVAQLAGSSHAKSIELMLSWWKKSLTPTEFKTIYETTYPEEDWHFSEILNPYVKFILPRLKVAGFKVAIASSSPMDAITTMVTECEIAHYFDLLVTGRDYPESKPDPTIYLSTMEKLEVDPQETFIVEDSNYGIEAGKSAGGTVIALRDPRFYEDQSTSDYLASDLLEVYQKIMELGGV